MSNRRNKTKIIWGLLAVVFIALFYFYFLYVPSSTKEFIDRLETALQKSPDGFYLRNATNFDWDRVCIYPEYATTTSTTPSIIESQTGIKIDEDVFIPDMNQTLQRYFLFFIFQGKNGNHYYALRTNNLEVADKKFFFRLPEATIDVFCGGQETFLKPDDQYSLQVSSHK